MILLGHDIMFEDKKNTIHTILLSKNTAISVDTIICVPFCDHIEEGEQKRNDSVVWNRNKDDDHLFLS